MRGACTAVDAFVWVDEHLNSGVARPALLYRGCPNGFNRHRPVNAIDRAHIDAGRVANPFTWRGDYGYTHRILLAPFMARKQPAAKLLLRKEIRPRRRSTPPS